MKPLNEWSATSLILQIRNGGDDSYRYVAELLRRERDRCAAACDGLAADLDERERRGGRAGRGLVDGDSGIPPRRPYHPWAAMSEATGARTEKECR